MQEIASLFPKFSGGHAPDSLGWHMVDSLGSPQPHMQLSSYAYGLYLQHFHQVLKMVTPAVQWQNTNYRHYVLLLDWSNGPEAIDPALIASQGVPR